ncbi:MAG: TIGR03960 family B12-binding radical SAM protein, partial [Anaerolineae bacterium]|nr:TIGR03960 family B12-binding radical SAM protein [Anaerolineae bacterium]
PRRVRWSPASQHLGQGRGRRRHVLMQPTPSRTTGMPIPWERIEALLHLVQKPGRYVGGEYNTVNTPWDAADLRTCLAFPDVYDIGMSNFALMILYDLLNRHPGTLAHRTYLPAPDMIAQMRGADLPLYALEDYHPVAAFDILAISTAYEQLYANALILIDLAGIPVRAVERDERYPLVVGGGHGTFNPEPIADFFDVFVIGEAEAVLLELVAAVRATRGMPRGAQLEALLRIPGLYIPRFYQPRYSPSGSLMAVSPVDERAPRRVLKRILPALPRTPVRQLVPNISTVHSRALVEIMRGCTRGCRFCQAGAITRPVRERPAAEIIDSALNVLDATGFEDLSLLSLSSADHSQVGDLVQSLLAQLEARHVSISLPSLRLDAFSVDLADTLSGGHRSGFTFAPEAATDALRHRINKDISTEDLFTVAEEVFKRGWRTIKLYFMIGLPGETDEDVAAIADLVRKVRSMGHRIVGPRAEIHVSVGTFIPKPQTPFQWESFADEATIEHRQELLRQSIRGRGLTLSWSTYEMSRLEALLARGDRRLCAVVERAWQLGAGFDGWDEWKNPDAWERAIAELPSDTLRAHFATPAALLDALVYRQRGEDEPLPWDHLESGVAKRYYVQEARRSRNAELLADCREGCHGCGIQQAYAGLHTEEWQCPVLR